LGAARAQQPPLMHKTRHRRDDHSRSPGKPSGGLKLDGFTFVTLGDWGGANLGSYHKTGELAVAKQMAKTMTANKSKFIINVGDNFYYDGIRSASDPLWAEDYEDVFTDPSSFVPWYSILGNHDYGFNPAAQLQYKSPHKDRWVMPARYWTKRVALGGSGKFASFVFLDTTPCVRENLTCSGEACDPPAREAPKFSANVRSQSCSTQFAWFKRTMSQIDAQDWIIVAGHHPADELNVEDFVSVFQEHNMDAYLAGHSHELELFNVDASGTPYIVSGAGCMVRIKEKARLAEADEFRALLRGSALAVGGAVDENVAGPAATPPGDGGAPDGGAPSAEADLGAGPVHLAATEGHEYLWSEADAAAYVGGARDEAESARGPREILSSGHKHQVVYFKKTAGFTLHSFANNFSVLKTDFIDYQGNVIYTNTVEHGAGPGPAPSPSPGPAPGPGGTCAEQGCKYGRLFACQCDGRCKKQKNCCPDYQAVCAPKSKHTCKAYGDACGKYFKTHDCQCNSRCELHNDCCSDYQTFCPQLKRRGAKTHFSSEM
jgi:acid phosphatase